MYASIADYPSVYGESSRRDSRTSLDKELLPPLIAEFCKSAGLRKLLDVSARQGWLSESLKAFGIGKFTTDFAPLPGSEVMSFDLASYAEEAVERILRTVTSGGANYLTTCFSALEHIDREHLAAAIRNLYELTDKILVVSLSTLPSSLDNLFHATLMPMSTWARAFEIAGFAVRKTQAFAPATRKQTFPESADHCLINRWVTADVYGDVQHDQPRYLILEKNTAGEPWGSRSDRIEHLVDVAYRRKKREHFRLSKDRRININLHHVQEWSLVRPILDVLPRTQTRFLMRPDWLGEDNLRAIRSFLKRNGVEAVEFSSIDELPWKDLQGEIIISGAESTGGGSHGLSYEVVATAKLHGCQTFLLQHGVWAPPTYPRIVTFASEHVLSWGKDEQARLNNGTHKIFAATVPWGVVPDQQVKAIGAAKFTDHLLGPIPELDVKLGFDASAFRKTVLVGTKSLARQFGTENINEEFLGTLAQLFSANPDVLFIIRPHPTESADAYASLKQPNVRIFDELTSILADMPLSRIVPKVDYVVTSPSTMILDGAITGRPVFVYDTGLPIQFDDVSVAPLGSFQGILSGTAGAERLKEDAKRYRQRYAEAVDDTFYHQLSALLTSDSPRPAVDRTTAAAASLAIELTQFTRYVTNLKTHVSALSAACRRAEEELPPLRAELDRARVDIGQLRASLNEQVAENARLTASRSWRYTGPVRHLIERARRLKRAALATLRPSPRDPWRDGQGRAD